MSDDDSSSGDDDNDSDEDSEQLIELKNAFISKVILADELRDAFEAADALRAEEDKVVEKGRTLEEAIRQQQQHQQTSKTVAAIAEAATRTLIRCQMALTF